MQNQFGILSDRQIRELCEPPLVMLSIEDTTTGSIMRYEKMATSSEALRQGQQLRHIRPLTEEEKATFKPMISPFSPVQVRTREVDLTRGHSYEKPFTGPRTKQEKVLSWGLSSYGYDIRCADEFLVFSNVNSVVIDPKNFDEKAFVKFKGDVCILPPNSFVLAHTVERFSIPRNVVVNCIGKSTMARSGVNILVTPLEPEWEGVLTLEFANCSNLPVKIYANEGCGQLQFMRGSEPCEVSYKDRQGKYQNQGSEPVPPKV